MDTLAARKRELDAARGITDDLFGLVRPKALYDRPIPERHRIVFYIGHLETFDWNLFSPAADLRPFAPDFDRLFAFGIDPPPGQLPRDTAADWPRIEAVRAYNARLRQEMDAALERVPRQHFDAAIEHRLMHAETFAYMLHELGYERKFALPGAVPAETRPADGMIEIPAGPARLGTARGTGFGWDNEFEAHTVEVPAFAIGRHKATNREYLEFVRQGAAAPHFWFERGGEWRYRGMFRDVPLPLDCPVYVTKREADAYAAWKGCTLPSEPQFHRAAFGDGTSWVPNGGNFDFRHWDPVSVTDAPGVAQTMDNGWEWTSTVFAPFPGFEPFLFYPGYSANFFDGEHYVLKGASPRTAARLARPPFRNWFRPDYPYVYATFRLAAV